MRGSSEGAVFWEWDNPTGGGGGKKWSWRRGNLCKKKASEEGTEGLTRRRSRPCRGEELGTSNGSRGKRMLRGKEDLPGRKGPPVTQQKAPKKGGVGMKRGGSCDDQGESEPMLGRIISSAAREPRCERRPGGQPRSQFLKGGGPRSLARITEGGRTHKKKKLEKRETAFVDQKKKEEVG